MSSLAVDGLISGLNTTELINTLMQVEAAPQTLLKRKSSNASTLVTALQSLNTKVASLATSAGKAANATSWQVQKVASSDSSVTASTSTGAQPSSLQFRVDSLAAAQVSMVDIADLDAPPTLSVVRNGEVHTVTAAGNSATEVADAINEAADLGLKAVAVRVSTDGGEDEYRLQLAGVTGEDNAFNVYAGAGTSGALLTSADTAAIKASNAKITLWPDTALGEGEQHFTLSSSTNTFEDVLTGVDVTVSAVTKADDAAVTVTVAQDTAATKSLASGLVNNISTVLSEIASRTKSTTSTSEDGREVVSGGLFSGNSTIRLAADQLRSAVSMPVDGRSPSQVGIKLDSTGAVSFDEAAFNAAMAADPAGTKTMVSAVAERLAKIAESASDPTEGTLSLQITAQESTVKDLNRQIEDWDRRLETRRSGLARTYSQLEVTLGQLQSQQSWLSGQLAGLPSWNTGS